MTPHLNKALRALHIDEELIENASIIYLRGPIPQILCVPASTHTHGREEVGVQEESNTLQNSFKKDDPTQLLTSKHA